jgi:hypothetical protein
MHYALRREADVNNKQKRVDVRFTEQADIHNANEGQGIHENCCCLFPQPFNTSKYLIVNILNSSALNKAACTITIFYEIVKAEYLLQLIRQGKRMKRVFKAYGITCKPTKCYFFKYRRCTHRLLKR